MNTKRKSAPKPVAPKADPVARAREEAAKIEQPSRIAKYAREVIRLKNIINGGGPGAPQTTEEMDKACDALCRFEYALFEHPAVTPADLAIKARLAACYLEPGGITEPGYCDLLEVRAWRGLLNDIERLASSVPVTGTVTMFADGRPDDLALSVPVLRDERGRSFGDTILHAIEVARTATRRANDPLADDEEIHRRTQAEDATYQDVFKQTPMTREGLLALIDYARERAEFQVNMAFNEGGQANDNGEQFPAAPDVLGAIRVGVAMLLDGVREIVPEGDGALIALGGKWEAIWKQYLAACEVVRACEERTPYPELPEALFVQPADRLLGIDHLADQTAEDSSGGGRWWYLAAAYPGGALRSKGPKFRYQPTPQAKARAAEIVAAFDSYTAEKEAAENASGAAAADLAVKALVPDLRALEQEITRIEATTLAGVLVKARVAATDYEAASTPHNDLVEGIIRGLGAIDTEQGA